MKIFYSWQSDSDAKLNRYFILNALEAVSKNCRKEGLFNLYIDQATREEPGSPNISDTIFKKIDGSNLFIADISIINPNSKERKTPNPNVLIELGYAIKKLGFKNTIFIFNSYYGNPNDLPFDIRQNRILPYCFDGSNKEEAADSLIKDLTIAIMTIEKKSISSDKIEIVYFYDGTEYGNTIELHKVKYSPISKEEFLKNIDDNKISSINIEKKTMWQEYLLKAIRTDRSRKEALRQLPKGQAYAYAEHRFLGDFTNVNYFEEYLEKALIRKNTHPLNFMIKNGNEKSLEKIKIVFTVEKYIPIFRYCDFPEYPKESKMDIIIAHKFKNESNFTFHEDKEKQYFEYDLKLLRIGESHKLDESLYIKLYEGNEPITIKYVIYFIDMPQIEGTLTITMNVREETINPDLIFEL